MDWIFMRKSWERTGRGRIFYAWILVCGKKYHGFFGKTMVNCKI